jgi:hypothetical protein
MQSWLLIHHENLRGSFELFKSTLSSILLCHICHMETEEWNYRDLHVPPYFFQERARRWTKVMHLMSEHHEGVRGLSILGFSHVQDQIVQEIF